MLSSTVNIVLGFKYNIYCQLYGAYDKNGPNSNKKEKKTFV